MTEDAKPTNRELAQAFLREIFELGDGDEPPAHCDLKFEAAKVSMRHEEAPPPALDEADPLLELNEAAQRGDLSAATEPLDPRAIAAAIRG